MEPAGPSLPAGGVLLQSLTIQVVLDPERGGSILAFRVLRGERWISVMPEPGMPGVDLWSSSFVMVPYSNRIAEGRFRWAGRTVQLANAGQHAIHGDVRKRPWNVDLANNEAVHLSFDSTAHANLNWPWAFRVVAHYALDNAGFSSTLSLTNNATEAVPAGFGFHPYFLRELSVAGEPCVVGFRVAGVYPDANGTRIPSGPAQLPTPKQDFSVPRTLNPTAFHDFCAHGYAGNATLEWPESKVRLRFETTPELGHLVFYNPPAPYFAVEPVTHANDGVNLFDRGDPTSGVRVLQPGETLTATFRIGVE